MTTTPGTTPEALSAPPADEHTDAGTSGTPNPENGSQGSGTEPPEQSPKGNREARYRVERNEARAERDELAQRVNQLQTREVERLAALGMSNPADVFTLGGVELADLLDEAGEVDPDKVTEVVNDILGTRPGLRPNAPATDPSQGHSGGGGKPSPTWADLLAD